MNVCIYIYRYIYKRGEIEIQFPWKTDPIWVSYRPQYFKRRRCTFGVQSEASKVRRRARKSASSDTKTPRDGKVNFLYSSNNDIAICFLLPWKLDSFPSTYIHIITYVTLRYYSIYTSLCSHSMNSCGILIIFALYKLIKNH